ncbi:MAG: GNAT family N-acetyltransferase [Phycisphaeraceae bacterium]
MSTPSTGSFPRRVARRLVRTPRRLLASRTLWPIVFTVRNVWCSRSLSPFTATELCGLQVGPMQPSHLGEIELLYRDMTEGEKLNRTLRLLLKMLGRRLCLTAVDPKSGRVVAMGIYYFNERDRIERSVHAGYSMVSPDFRGCGIGTALRRRALEHFQQSGLQGMSSRITLSNVASWKVAQRNGFVVRDHYYDQAMQEQRAYLWCDLSQHAPPETPLHDPPPAT